MYAHTHEDHDYCQGVAVSSLRSSDQTAEHMPWAALVSRLQKPANGSHKLRSTAGKRFNEGGRTTQSFMPRPMDHCSKRRQHYIMSVWQKSRWPGEV